MSDRRTYAEHAAPRKFAECAALLRRFAEHVDALTPDAWARISARCAALSGDSFRALLERVRIHMQAHQLHIPGTGRLLPLRAISVLSDAVQAGLATVFELTIEFEGKPEKPRRYWKPGDRPEYRDYAEAQYLIGVAVFEHAHSEPGVAAMFRAVGQAVLMHDLMAPETFMEIYRYVEPEIPFSSLEPPRALLPAETR